MSASREGVRVEEEIVVKDSVEKEIVEKEPVEGVRV